MPTLRRHVSERWNFSHCATPLLPNSKKHKIPGCTTESLGDRPAACCMTICRPHATQFFLRQKPDWLQGGTLFGAKSLGLSRVKFMAFSLMQWGESTRLYRLESRLFSACVRWSAKYLPSVCFSVARWFWGGAELICSWMEQGGEGLFVVCSALRASSRVSSKPIRDAIDVGGKINRRCAESDFYGLLLMAIAMWLDEFNQFVCSRCIFFSSKQSFFYNL